MWAFPFFHKLHLPPLLRPHLLLFSSASGSLRIAFRITAPPPRRAFPSSSTASRQPAGTPAAAPAPTAAEELRAVAGTSPASGTIVERFRVTSPPESASSRRPICWRRCGGRARTARLVAARTDMAQALRSTVCTEGLNSCV